MIKQYARKKAKFSLKGDFIILFIGIAVPVFIAMSFIAVDATRLYLDRYTVTDAALAAVQAGSNQITSGLDATNGPTLNPAKAVLVATNTWNTIVQSGALPANQIPASAVFTVSPSETSITGTIKYNVNNLIFLQYFVPSTKGSPAFTVQVNAGICIAGKTAGPSFGNCVPPSPVVGSL